MNPMPMLTNLTLEFIRLDNEDLNMLNKSIPNLQVLNLVGVGGLKLPKINLLDLKACHLTVSNAPSSLTLITPTLITLRLECIRPTSLYIDAPIFPFTKAVEKPNSQFTKVGERGSWVFRVFPNVNYLCINSTLWSELELGDLDGRKGLKTFCAYLLLVDPLLTFSSVASLLDQCVELVDVSLLIHRDVVANVSKSFISRCGNEEFEEKEWKFHR
uniref:Uncharacterized protein n=1 Tax=Lactuca sativa TaxID=4236 RepID=A0A9R1UWQ5_LACSA|nr:hypothetical protein LSAT_V11C700357900 [Lactuca sativa]